MWENVTLLTEVEHIVRTCSSFFSIRLISDYQMDNYQLYHSETKCPNYWPDLYQTKHWATGKVFRVMKVYDICDRCKCLSKCIENLPISSKILKQDEFRNIERDLDLEFPHEGIHNGLGQKLLRHLPSHIKTVWRKFTCLCSRCFGVLSNYILMWQNLLQFNKNNSIHITITVQQMGPQKHYAFTPKKVMSISFGSFISIARKQSN